MWVTILEFLKKIWEFIKKNWLSILAVIGVISIVLYGYSALKSLMGADNDLIDRITHQEERHIQDLADLNQIMERQLRDQKQINEEYNTKLQELDKRFTEELDKIRARTRARRTKLSNDPTALGNEITNVFGIPQGGSR